MTFSIKVYDDFIDAVDSQKRFLLKSDLELFSQFRLSIDDQINSSDIAFFNLVYETLKKRIDEVENFYGEILEVPFNFQINEEINLDYENLEYASSSDELKKIWRKRLKAFCS
jgi:carboxyl-terminal processing protease